jgi:predicted dehydrogenase
MTLAGIWRRSTEGRAQAQRWSTTFCPDWRELIVSSGVDAVVGVVPPVLNPAIAAACACAGKPLLLEKPLARNVGEARAIVASLATAGVPLTVGQTLRYNPVIGELRRQLPEMGRLYGFAVNQRLEPSTLDWHDDRDTAGAGVLFHTAVHVFDAMRLITGLKVRRVMAQGRLVHAAVLEDQVLVIAELENGVIGTVDVSKVGRARTGRYEFVGADGQLHGEQIHAFTEVIRGNVVQSRREFAPIPTVLQLLRDWLKFLEGDGDNPVTGEEGLYAVQVCEACLVSLQEGGRWVKVQ